MKTKQGMYETILKKLLSPEDGIEQTIKIEGVYIPGPHDTELSLKQIDFKGAKNFLDLGCNIGAFCTEAIKQGCKIALGIEKNKELIQWAKALNPEGDYIRCDFNNTERLGALVDNHFQGGRVDILCMFSTFYDVINLEAILDIIDWKVCYIESNRYELMELVLGLRREIMNSKYKSERLTVYKNPGKREIWKLTQ